MSTIKKINFNNLFYFDNINPTLTECFQIKEICSKWAYAKNYNRFAELNFNKSSLFEIKKFILDTHKHPKNYILSTKHKNGKILYISYLNESLDVKNAVEIDVLSNSKRKVDPTLDKKDFFNIWDHYIQLAISMSNTNKYEDIIFNIHKDNKLMHKTIEKGLCAFSDKNNFPVYCITEKGDYKEYKVKL